MKATGVATSIFRNGSTSSLAFSSARYLNQSMVAVPFDGSGDEPVIGKPAALFRDEFDLGQGIAIANYDVTKDGRFLLLRRDAKGIGLRIVLNWTEELKRIIEQGGGR